MLVQCWSQRTPHHACDLLIRAGCLLLLWMCAASAHAGSVYRCTDAQGHLAFQDTPCTVQAGESEIDLRPQPLIGAPGEHAAREAADEHRIRSMHRSRKPRARSRRKRAKKPVMSWECHAADGEVFYRHTRCPSSVPGDGVVRIDYTDTSPTPRHRRRHNAWSRVRVHGVKIPRVEACRRIHSPGAAVRDGHQRDATVSTYDHLMGRDPCEDG